jgi:hypothetical protein
MGSRLPDIFLFYNRDDQAIGRQFAEGFEREGFNLEGIERANTLVFAPETAQDMNATLRRVWLDTPLESSRT